MSAEISRVAVQTVCKNLYDHNYFLSKDEAMKEILLYQNITKIILHQIKDKN